MLQTLCRRMSSTISLIKRNNLIAVCQLNSNHDMTENLNVCRDLINRAGQRNCKVRIFFESSFMSKT